MSSIPYRIIAKFGYNYVQVNNNSNEVIYKCPECLSRKGTPDKVGHLYVNLDTCQFFCHRCNYSGVISKYQSYNKDRIYDEEHDHSLDELIRGFKSIVSDNNEDFRLKIPIDKVTTSSTATKYLLDRGFTYEQMQYYDMRVGNLEQEFGRIIIPNKVSKLVYTDAYSARTYIGQKPKYHNPSDIKKSEIVFNLHRIKEGSPVILVEGALTAIAAGYHGIASLGKTLSNYQAALIAKKKPSVVYLNYDYGAEKEALAACALLKKYLPETPIKNVIMYDERDAADMTREEYLECLNRAEEYNPLYTGISNIL